MTALCGPAAATITITAESTVPAVMMDQGRVTGHAAEKVHEIMRRAGFPYTIALMPWKRAITLAHTQANTCVFMTTRTAERETWFHWIGPISQADWVLYGRADRQFNIQSLDDVRGLRIGAYNGDVRGEFLREQGLNVEFVQNDDSNPRKLMLNRIDLWVNSTRSSRAVLARVGLTGQVVPVHTYRQVKLYLACNASIPDADVARMHAALRSMEADGTYKAIEQRFEYLQKAPLANP
ncbi:MAG TPA: transporter substrate-binding domain-containing protein [Telluria sp.]